MEKPYDFKVLGESLKLKGLDLTEEALKIVYAEMKVWLKASALLSENKIDDVVMQFLDQADGVVHEQIDRIDGQKDI